MTTRDTSQDSGSAAAWAIRMPGTMSHALAPLRLLTHIEVAETADRLWVRGPSADAATRTILATLPADARYTWLVPEGRLRPLRSLLASERFPDVTWCPLQAWLAIAAPVARFPAGMPDAIPLELRRSHDPRPANAAIAGLSEFIAWVQHAPGIRLARLRFAASDRGRALVLGTPLPDFPLTPCVQSGGIVVPAGFAWYPGVPAMVVRRVLGVPESAVVLWEESGAQTLPGELFVPASHASARATQAASTGEGRSP